MALRLFDVAANTADTVAEGAPYYFSWSPDGTQLVAHMGDERVEVQGADGKRSTIAAVAPGFGAPQWSAVGDLLLFAVADERNRRLVVSDAVGAQQRELTDFDERISAAMSPDATQVAYALTPDVASANTLGPLYVTDIATLRTKQLSARPVWAFEWSPDGTRLAWLAAERLDGAFWMRWNVWDGETTKSYAPFLPSRTYLNDYLTYSDQYAQSTRLWSPDSTAIAYAGKDRNERRGIWVQQLDASEPEWVSGGVMVTWSPR
jgi:TolB protein